jgi:hypothetical protein
MRIKPTSAYENMWIYYILIVCLSVTVSTTNPTRAGLGMSQGIRSEWPATNRLSQGTATRFVTVVNRQGNVPKFLILTDMR